MPRNSVSSLDENEISVGQLGYIGFEVPDVNAWKSFFVDVVGLMPANPSEDGSLGFRLDEYERRFIVHEGAEDDIAYLGWEVKDSSALEAMLNKVLQAGVSVIVGDADLLAKRQVEGLIYFNDPNDIRTEIFWGPRIAEQEFHSALVPNGFVTGAGGLGHAVFGVKDWNKTFDFYTKVMGLKLSDYIKDEPFPSIDVHVTFLHANQRHHSYAFLVPPIPFPKKLQHFMVEARDMSAVGFAFDRFNDAEVPIAMALGHHPNDEAFSFYAQAPNGIEIEFGWGPILIDDAEWQPRTYSQLSDWGHKRPGF